MTLVALRSRWASGLLIVPLLVASCASPPRVAERRVEQTAAQLQRQTDADSLAAAGLFAVVKNRSEALALLARASAAAPERAELVSVLTQVCQEEPSCDPQADEQRLRRLSPDNGAGWMGALTRAVKAHDEAAQDGALAAIGHTERVDIYWTTLIAHLSVAVARTGKMSLADAMTTVTGIVTAMAIPAYASASHSCMGDRLQRADILEACRGVASAFENGDTAITEMMGVAIAKRVWPEGSPEWKSAAEHRRVYNYRAAACRSLESATLRQAQAQKFVAWYLERHGEQEVMRMELIDAGKPPDPPPI